MKPSRETLKDLYHKQGLSQTEIGQIYNRNQRTISLWLKQYGIDTGFPSRKDQLPSCEKLRDLYIAQGLSQTDIGKIYERTQGAIYFWLIKCKIESRGCAKKEPIPASVLQDLYHEQGLSLYQVGKKLGRSASNTLHWMHQHNLETRSVSKAIRLQERGHAHNRDFFKHWSPEMAWVLGLMFSDGSVCKSSPNGYRATLTSIDKDMLQQVARLVETDAQPMKWNKPAFTLNIGSSTISEDLIALGCVPNKSRIMQFPKVPKDHLGHFVRGLWDGDGNIFVRNRQRGLKTPPSIELRASYVSGSKEFVESLRNTITNSTSIDADVKRRQAQYNPFYVLTYYTHKAHQVLTWIYQNSTPETRLGRKYEKWTETL